MLRMAYAWRAISDRALPKGINRRITWDWCVNSMSQITCGVWCHSNHKHRYQNFHQRLGEEIFIRSNGVHSPFDP